MQQTVCITKNSGTITNCTSRLTSSHLTFHTSDYKVKTVTMRLGIIIM